MRHRRMTTSAIFGFASRCSRDAVQFTNQLRPGNGPRARRFRDMTDRPHGTVSHSRFRHLCDSTPFGPPVAPEPDGVGGVLRKRWRRSATHRSLTTNQVPGRSPPAAHRWPSRSIPRRTMRSRHSGARRVSSGCAPARRHGRHGGRRSADVRPPLGWLRVLVRVGAHQRTAARARRDLRPAVRRICRRPGTSRSRQDRRRSRSGRPFRPWAVPSRCRTSMRFRR